jgi:hypothetical protein
LTERIKIWIEKKFYKVYKTLDFIPVGCFFKILETEDLRYLFRLKNYETLPTITYQPKEIWTKMYNEFLSLSGGFSMFGYISDYANIVNKKELFLRLKHAAFLLSIKEDKELIEIVKQCGYKFDYTHEVEYSEALLNLNRQLIGLSKIIEKKSDEFVKKYKKNSKPIDIYEILSNFEQYKQRRIDPWTTTMREFITIQKNYKDWVKIQNGRK